MGQPLAVELSDDVYAAIQRQAVAAGTSAAQIAAASLERQFRTGAPPSDEAEKEAARRQFERHFGEADLGYETGVDNERIDADLGREYADRHEEG